MIQQYTAEVKGLQTQATLECAEDDWGGKEALVLVPGLGATEMTGLRQELVKLGHAAISFEHPRTGYARYFGNVGELRARTVHEVVRNVTMQHGVGRVALVGHSLGGMDSVRAAQMVEDSEDVSSIELLATAGMTGERFFTILKHLYEGGKTEMMQGNAGLVDGVLRNFLRSPAQLIAEGYYGQKRDIIEELGELAKLTDIGMVQFKNDVIFPVSLVNSRIAGTALGEHVTSGLVRSCVATETKHACHISPQCDPEGTAGVLDKMLYQRESMHELAG
jgi:pimeloyl-ACP methyl ester carboxylesterase